jgi:hypothetical protein
MATEKPFLCYRELLPPNNVACATFFAGSDSGSEYLLTASVSVIRVYKVCRRDSIGEDGFDAHLHNSVRPHLSLRAVVPIYARPFDVKVFASGDHHNIILSCDEGKILCLRFNEQIDTLYEHALINVEENAFGVGAEVKINSGANMLPGTGKEPYLAVDEDKKLVCACVYADKLVFIPFNKKIVEPSIIVDTESTSTTTPTPTTSSSIPRFVINMLEDLLLPGAVIDFAFMSGYAQPTLAVLQEQPMPVGHAAQSMHTCTLTVLTVDVYQQSCSILWQRKHLPHDSVRIVCIHIKDHADSQNGHRKERGFGLEHTVFVVSMNALIACSFDGVCAIATNGFASITVHQSILNGNTNPVVTAAAAAASSGGRNAVGAIQNWSMPEGVELDASRWCVLANTDSGEEDNMYTLVSALKDGKLIAWHLHTHNNATTINNFQVKFEVELLGSSVCASVLCTNALSSKLHNSNDLLFVGSSFADSLLMYVNRRRRRASSLELSSLYSSGNLWSAMYTHNTTSTVASAADNTDCRDPCDCCLWSPCASSLPFPFSTSSSSGKCALCTIFSICSEASNSNTNRSCVFTHTTHLSPQIFADTIRCVCVQPSPPISISSLTSTSCRAAHMIAGMLSPSSAVCVSCTCTRRRPPLNTCTYTSDSPPSDTMPAAIRLSVCTNPDVSAGSSFRINSLELACVFACCG